MAYQIETGAPNKYALLNLLHRIDVRLTTRGQTVNREAILYELDSLLQNLCEFLAFHKARLFYDELALIKDDFTEDIEEKLLYASFYPYLNGKRFLRVDKVFVDGKEIDQSPQQEPYYQINGFSIYLKGFSLEDIEDVRIKYYYAPERLKLDNLDTVNLSILEPYFGIIEDAVILRLSGGNFDMSELLAPLSRNYSKHIKLDLGFEV